jgi:hypothetical protein
MMDAWIARDAHELGVHCRRSALMMPAAGLHVGTILNLSPDSAPKSMSGATTAGQIVATGSRDGARFRGLGFIHITSHLNDEQVGRARHSGVVTRGS